MKLKDLLEKYGEYEVSASFQFGSSEGIQIRLEPPKTKTNTVWGLKDGDSHYWIDGVGKVKKCDIWRNNSYDPMAREVGNIFLTEEEAEKDVERKKVETLLLKHGGRRYFDGYNHNYHIGLDEYEEHLKAYILMTPTQGTIYFDTSARAQKSIDEIGEDRIKKALFEVR